MRFTQNRIRQVKSRLITGKIIDILSRRGLLFKIEHLGMEDWNGKMVMVNKITSLTLEEQEALEQEINEQVNLMI